MGEQFRTNDIAGPREAGAQSRSVFSNQALDLTTQASRSTTKAGSSPPEGGASTAETWQDRDKRLGQQGFHRLDANGHEFYWRNEKGELMRDQQGKPIPAYHKYEMQRDQCGRPILQLVWAPMQESGLKTAAVRPPEPMTDKGNEAKKEPAAKTDAKDSSASKGNANSIETWQDRDARLAKDGFHRLDANGTEFYWRDDKGQLVRDNHGQPIPAYHKYETVKNEQGQDTQRLVWAPQEQSGLLTKLASSEDDKTAQTLATKSDELAKKNGLNDPDFRKSLSALVERGGVDAANAFAEKTGPGYFVSVQESAPGEVTMQFYKVQDGNKETIAADLKVKKADVPAPPAPGPRPGPGPVPPPPRPNPPPTPESSDEGGGRDKRIGT